MNINSLGDMAQTFRLRQQQAHLKEQMSRLTEELSSGNAADVTRQLSGNFGHLTDIEHELQVLDRYRVAVNEAALNTSAMQSVLETVQLLVSDLSKSAIIANTTNGGMTLDTIGSEARSALDSMVSALNTEVAGRALFSGTDVEAIPLAASETLMTEVRTAVAGALTAADVQTALDTFFDTPGGGFETLIYQGGTDFLSPFQLGEGESIGLDLRADDMALRQVLKNTVMAALADEPSLVLTNAERTELAQQSGERLVTSQDDIIGIRADLGYAQSRIEQTTARISSEVSSLNFARNSLLSVDKFQTATELENVQVQLETLYTLTARTSRLSLVNFLS